MRKLMVVVGAVAGLALVSGCKPSNRDAVSEERQELAHTQQEAQKDLAEIRQEESKELAEVRQDSQEEVASAREEVMEKRQDVVEAEKEGVEERSAGASTLATPPVQVSGTLVSTLGNDFTLRVANGRELKLETNEATRVLHNNRSVELDKFKEGTEVRTSYVKEGDEYMAREVTILRPVME